MGEREHTPGRDRDDAFTHGPWEMVSLSGYGSPFSIRMAYHSDHQNAPKTHYGVQSIRRIEDARLIAAAPELYYELDMQVRNCPLCKGDGVTNQSSENLVRVILGEGDASEMFDCPRCKSARLALSKASPATAAKTGGA